MDALTARKTWRSMESVHGMIYFTPDAIPAYKAVGVETFRGGYFASRVAPMGAVCADVVIATFYNFNPSLVRHAMDGLWQQATPQALLDARLNAVHTSLSRAFGTEMLQSSELQTTAETLRGAALVACERLEGRPLFAAHAALPWPTEPHLVLWHAQTLLREFRGDGHIAALVNAGLTGLQALISHSASGDVPKGVLQVSRAYSDEEWAVGVAQLEAQGLVNADGSFTPAGKAQRDDIEAATDRNAVSPYGALGLENCAEVRRVGKVLTQMVVDAGLMKFDPRWLADSPRS